MIKRYITLKDFVILGNKYLGELAPGDIAAPVWAVDVFADIYRLFDGSLNNVYIEGDTPTPLLPYYKTEFGGFLQMMNDFVARYGERLIASPWYEGMDNVYYGRGITMNKIDNCTEEQAFNLILFYLTDKTRQWMAVNSYEVQRIQSVLQLDYNPIENYNLDEQHKGEKSLTKTINDNEIGFIDVNAPVTSLAVSRDQETGKYRLDSVTMASEKDIEASSNSANLSTNLNGQVGSSVTAGANGSSWTTTAGTIPTTTEKVTTYDSDTFHNNKETTESGDMAVGVQSANYAKSQLSANAEIRLGSPDAGYKETEDYSKLGLQRKGNIGVTTTQQMIEQELILRERPHIEKIIDNYFNNMLIQVL